MGMHGGLEGSYAAVLDVLERRDDHPNHEAQARGSADHAGNVGRPQKQILTQQLVERPEHRAPPIAAGGVPDDGWLAAGPDELHAKDEVGGEDEQRGRPGEQLDALAAGELAHVGRRR
eukprot:scaffold364007_cov34-Prasinocladus_malaysianus.AAC.3